MWGPAHDLHHLFFQLVENFRRESHITVDIVEETVLDSRTDGQKGLGIKTHDRLSQHMGRAVPIGVLAVRIVEGQDGQVRVLIDRSTEIDGLAVDLCRAGGFGQSGTDASCDLDGRDAGGEFPNVAA